MEVIKKILACACLMFSITVLTDAKEWRGIIPLHSTRADVERLLGLSVPEALTGSCRCLYQLEDVNVHILYANGLPCGAAEQRDGRVGGWKVPRDTVIEIAVYFKSGRHLSELKIDESKYEKVTDPELPGLFYYTNVEEGVTIEVGGHEARSITYFAAAKDNNFRCSSPNVKPPCK
jgi:hypothetical protein